MTNMYSGSIPGFTRPYCYCIRLLLIMTVPRMKMETDLFIRLLPKFQAFKHIGSCSETLKVPLSINSNLRFQIHFHIFYFVYTTIFLDFLALHRYYRELTLLQSLCLQQTTHVAFTIPTQFSLFIPRNYWIQNGILLNNKTPLGF